MKQIFAISIGLLFLSLSSAVLPQETATVEQTEEAEVDPTLLAPDVAADFEERLALVAFGRRNADRIELQIKNEEGVRAQLLNTRLDVALRDWFQSVIELTEAVLGEREKGKEIGLYLEPLVLELHRVPAVGKEIMDRLEEQVVFPDKSLAPAEMVIADQQLLKIIKDIDAIYTALLTYIEFVEKVGLDESDLQQHLALELSDASANRSVFLKMALDKVAILKGAVATMPTDADLPQQLSAAQARVTIASQGLQSSVALMNRLELETRQYRQQLLTATGELTTDVLDVGLVAGLIADWSKAVFDYSKTQGPRVLFRILIVILVLIGFWYLSKFVKKGVARALQSSSVNISTLLKDMIVAMTKNIVMFLGFLFALSQLGISVGPLLAGLGIAGFIVGFALQDTLSNFASGMMILVYRPFDVADIVDAGGITGKVERMSLVNTTFKTFDNQVIIVPNNMIWQQVITNLTAQKTRRIDLTFGISYSDDIDKAKSILRDVIENEPACLKTPEPNIRVGALGESSVDIICRPWVKTEDYWDTFWDLTEAVKKRFDEEGITIPFPQRELHMHPGQAT